MYLLSDQSIYTLCCCVFCCADCPPLVVEALNGSKCDSNNDIILRESSKLALSCIYDLPVPSTTFYEWFLDGVVQPEFSNKSVSNILIPPGDHKVMCKAFLFPNAAPNSECSCSGTYIVNITVVGTSSTAALSNHVSLIIYKLCYLRKRRR